MRNKDTGRDDGWVTFKHSDDAKAALSELTTKYGVLVDYAILQEGDPDSEQNVPPSDTLCVVGFGGSKSELRRYFHEFRDKIVGVRCREYLRLVFSLRRSLTSNCVFSGIFKSTGRSLGLCIRAVRHSGNNDASETCASKRNSIPGPLRHTRTRTGSHTQVDAARMI